jgi:CubicO group peptidase (beta-lactamase class C family)
VVDFFEAVRDEVEGQPLVPSRAVAHPGEGRFELFADLVDGRTYRVEVGVDADGRVAGLHADVVRGGAEAGCPEPRLPDAPIGDRFRALLALLCDPTVEARRAFVAEHADPGFVDEVGPDALVAGLGRLAEEVGRREVVGVMLRSETAGAVAVETPDGELRVSLRLADAAPHRIVGLDVEDGPSGSDFGSLGEVLDHVAAEAEAGRFSGVVLVARDGRVVEERAYGWADRERGERVAPDTRFNIGSINKELTAVAILQLAERGLVDLDQTIGAYLDGFPPEASDAVTVRHLLQHRSGWGHYWDHPDFAGREAEVVEIGDFLDLVRAMPLDFEPGAREQYSNAGYEVLGGIVEAASGQRYADYVWEHVLEPAGMTDARTARHGAPGHATPYLGAGYDAPSPTAKAPSAAGGGYATARDLLRFQNALADGRLLGPEARALLFNRFEPTDGPVEPSVGIAGGAPGINAVWEWDAPSGWSVVVLANREPPAAEALGLPLLRAARAGS